MSPHRSTNELNENLVDSNQISSTHQDNQLIEAKEILLNPILEISQELQHTTETQGYHMVTRSKRGIFKPKYPFVGLAEAENHSEPSSIKEAMSCPQWRKAMQSKYVALVKNNTWELVPHSGQDNVVGCKWVFRIKNNPDGTIQRHKARLVAKGFQQNPSIDFTRN